MSRRSLPALVAVAVAVALLGAPAAAFAGPPTGHAVALVKSAHPRPPRR